MRNFIFLTLLFLSVSVSSQAGLKKFCFNSALPKHFHSPEGSDFTSYFPNPLRFMEGYVTNINKVPLTSKNLLEAYSKGLFPWNPKQDGTVAWFNMPKHGIIELKPLVNRSRKNSRKLHDAWNKGVREGWKVSFNRAYKEVIDACKNHDRNPEHYSHVWLTKEVRDAFVKLHEEGHAFSVEIWDKNGLLIGGTYGIYQNGMYSPESMFFNKSVYTEKINQRTGKTKIDYTYSGAGKVAAIAAAERLANTGHFLMDSQTVNENTRTNYYAIEVSRKEYLKIYNDHAAKTSHVIPEVLFAADEPVELKDLTHPKF